MKRQRALDKLESPIDAYKRLNPFFSHYVDIFDDVFSKNDTLNKESYVERIDEDTSFEKKLLDSLLRGATRSNGKIYFLIGRVGHGKTSTSQYLAETLAPKVFPGSLSTIFDLTSVLPTESLGKWLTEQLVSKLCQECIKSAFFQNNYEFYRSVFEHLGYELGPEAVLRNRKTIDLEGIVDYMCNTHHFDRVLLIFDNIDENTKESFNIVMSFIMMLHDYLRRYPGKPVSLLVPIREYIPTRYHDINKYPSITLPRIDEKQVIKKRFEESKEKILQTVSSFRFNLDYTLGSEQSRNFIVDSSNANRFLDCLIDQVFHRHERNAIDLIKNISSDNLKVIVANTYNLIHSYKLPLSSLFLRAFAPDTSREIVQQKNKPYISYDLGVECLLAIHFPFYDKKASSLINLFYTKLEPDRLDFRNTFIMLRLLCFVKNLETVTFKQLKNRFSLIGYDESIVVKALGKTIHYGILYSDHGSEVAHFSDGTVLTLQTAGIEYLDRLIYTPSYLQYVCEDVPMEEQFIVSIDQKYKREDETGSKKKRLHSVDLLLQFLASEEECELASLGKKGAIIENFLLEFSIIRTGNGLRISEAIGSTIESIYGVQSSI